MRVACPAGKKPITAFIFQPSVVHVYHIEISAHIVNSRELSFSLQPILNNDVTVFSCVELHR